MPRNHRQSLDALTRTRDAVLGCRMILSHLRRTHPWAVQIAGAASMLEEFQAELDGELKTARARQATLRPAPAGSGSASATLEA